MYNNILFLPAAKWFMFTYMTIVKKYMKFRTGISIVAFSKILTFIASLTRCIDFNYFHKLENWTNFNGQCTVTA